MNIMNCCENCFAFSAEFYYGNQILDTYLKQWATWALTSKSAPRNTAAARKLGLSLAGFSRAGPQRVTEESLVGITHLILKVKKVKSGSSPTDHS